MLTEKTPTDIGKEMYATLKREGMLEYGSIILSEQVRRIAGIVEPDTGTKKEFQDVALRELAITDYVRNILLGEGKYLKGTPAGYRILLPSENSKQVELYMGSADSKLRRALKLARNSPQGDFSLDGDVARLSAKRRSLKAKRAQEARLK